MNKIMPILTTSGLRGVVGQDLFPAYLVRVGTAFGSFIGGGTCAIAADTRSSNMMASSAVISGLLSQGCTIYDLGVMSTPAVFRKVLADGLGGGLSITSSHNPPEWNGVKFILPTGRGPFEDELNRLNNLIEGPIDQNLNFDGRVIKSDGSEYVNQVVRFVGEQSCKGVKVAIDAGGGVASLFISDLFKALGCNVYVINGAPGVFSREIDPTADDLSTLSQTVLQEGCQVGFAFDCDGDRVLVVDAQGRKLAADTTLLICLMALLQKNMLNDFVVSVDTTRAVEDFAHNVGVKVVHSKVGEANVVAEMLARGYSVGGEGSSGGVIISDFCYCRDGALASALISNMILREGSLNNILNKIPQYHQVRRKILCDRAKALQAVNELSKEYPEGDNIDGLRIVYEDGSWVLIRASGTEDSLRVSAESKSQDRTEKLAEKFLSTVYSKLKGL